MKLAVCVVLSLISSVALAAEPVDPNALLTVGEADRMMLEANSIITTSVGAVAFFLGWVAGGST